MESEFCLLFAENDPARSGEKLYPNEIYKNPQLVIKKAQLDNLHPDYVRVLMKYVGICGTDVHLLKTDQKTGYILGSAPLYIPREGRRVGHEGVGYVIDTGSHVTHIHKNEYIVFESILTCHYCYACRRGKFNQCINSKLLGMEIDGLFGTIVDVPASLAHNITHLVKHGKQNLLAATCIEPAAVAYVACENAGLSPAEKVVVFGAGPIGVFSAILAKRIFGASEVYMVEPVKFRNNLAKRWCDAVLTVEEMLNDPPDNIDVIFETAGFVEGINKVFTRLNCNSRVVLLARMGNILQLRDIDHIITNEISIIGSRGHLCGAFSKILKLMKHNLLDLTEVITNIDEGIEKLLYYLQTSPDKIINENCKLVINIG